MRGGGVQMKSIEIDTEKQVFLIDGIPMEHVSKIEITITPSAIEITTTSIDITTKLKAVNLQSFDEM